MGPIVGLLYVQWSAGSFWGLRVASGFLIDRINPLKSPGGGRNRKEKGVKGMAGRSDSKTAREILCDALAGASAGKSSLRFLDSCRGSWRCCLSHYSLSLAFLIGTRPLGCGGGGCRGDRGDLRLPAGRDQDAASGPRPAWDVPLLFPPYARVPYLMTLGFALVLTVYVWAFLSNHRIFHFYCFMLLSGVWNENSLQASRTTES